jgi:large conductance mechanosensitive channel
MENSLPKLQTMGMFKEFKDFAMRGNVIDLAVAVVIGGAFGKIVTSFVKDIITPIIGSLFKADFTAMKMVLQPEILDADGNVTQELVAITYGNFITTVIDFIIIAFAIFMVVKAMNAAKKKEEEAPAPAPPEPSDEVKLLTEIRDSLSR